MSRQTDRQTPPWLENPRNQASWDANKATHWACTLYGEEVGKALDMQKDPNHLPGFVKVLYGGLEQCPETKRLHFQGHIHCNRQVRLTQLKSIWPTGHFERARDINASIRYAMKSDTAYSEKLKTDSTLVHQSPGEIALKVARALINKHSLDDNEIYVEWMYKIACEKSPAKKISDLYWEGVSEILSNDSFSLKNPGAYVRPDVRAIWSGCFEVYMKKALTFSITVNAPAEDTPVNEIISVLSINSDARSSSSDSSSIQTPEQKPAPPEENS